MKIPKCTDEEVKILWDIEDLWERCESSIADLELQEQKLSEEMKHIIDGHHGANLGRMEEMMNKLRETRISEECYSSQENILSELRQKIYSRACNRIGEERK